MDDDLNPYQAPQAEGYELVYDQPFYVQGELLIVKSGTRLPARCVLTNVPVSDDDYFEHKLTWKGKSFQLVIDAHRGSIFWGMAKPIRRKQKIYELVSMIPLILMIVLLGMNILLGYNISIWVIIVGQLAMSALIGLLFQPFTIAHPRVTNFEKEYYWIAGCHADYLASLRAELE